MNTTGQKSIAIDTIAMLQLRIKKKLFDFSPTTGRKSKAKYKLAK